MQYLLMIYGNEAGMQAASKDQVTQMSAAYMAYTEAMKQAGVIRGGERLRPTSEATTVRVKNGKTEVLDGPYADTKEQLGGFFMIDVPDLDAALSWAAKCPGASMGTMEVRPIWPMQSHERAARRAMPPRTSRAAATASSSPIFRRARAMSRPRRMRSLMPSRQRSPTGPRRAFRKVRKLGCSLSRAARRSTRHGAGAPARSRPGICK